MGNPKSKLAATLSAGIVLGALGMHTLSAQQSGIQRVLLQRTDVAPSPATLEAVAGTAEIPAGGAAGRHTHPGIELGYVLSGAARMEIEGESPRDLKAGDSYLIAGGKAHDAKVIGDTPAKVLACYVVEKGKPLSSPAS